MTKTKLVGAIAGLAALVAVVLILLLPNPPKLAVEGPGQLPEGQAILVDTTAERFGVLKGDVSLYLVEALYDSDQVSQIDKASLDANVNLQPFEIRDVKEAEFNLNSRVRVYQRLYEIQLINGEVEQLYEFPTIVIRYKLKDAAGLSELAVMPEPIYVGSRLPADVGTLVGNIELGFGPLRPVKGEIEDISQNRLPWLLWVFGGFVAAVAVADLNFRVIPGWKEKEKKARQLERDNVFYQAYCSLHENVAAGAKPKALLHQINQIMRVILGQKEKIGWLEDPDLELVSAGIRPTVISLAEKSQRAYGPEDIEQKDIEAALKSFEDVFNFYFPDEVETWKSWLGS